MKKKASFYIIIYIIVSLIGFVFIIKYFPETPSSEEYFENVVHFTRSQDYNGIVKNKYYDKKDHNLRKLHILENYVSKTVNINFEGARLFDFIKVGDTIIKQKNQLYVHVKRIGLDTIIQLKFENVKGSEN